VVDPLRRAPARRRPDLAIDDAMDAAALPNWTADPLSGIDRDWLAC